MKLEPDGSWLRFAADFAEAVRIAQSDVAATA
jgi:hypothetical protein